MHHRGRGGHMHENKKNLGDTFNTKTVTVLKLFQVQPLLVGLYRGRFAQISDDFLL